jgi:hypothetical protein
VKPSRDIARLIEIMAALRAPGSGCPWDIQYILFEAPPAQRKSRPEAAGSKSEARASTLLDGIVGKHSAERGLNRHFRGVVKSRTGDQRAVSMDGARDVLALLIR